MSTTPRRHVTARIIHALKFLAVVGVCFLTMGAMEGCNTPPKNPVAEPTTPKGSSPVPKAINEVGTNATAAIEAVEKKVVELERQGAKVAASVSVATAVNTNQPPGPFTEFVDRELRLASDRLPKPDPAELLVAEHRKVAVLAGQVEETRKLYAAAQTETERMKAENAKLKSEADDAKAKHAAAQTALIEADKRWAAQLEANKAANQAKIDAANKRADEAEEKAKNERHKTIFRALLGLGIACIIAGIALGVATNGTMLMKSLMLAGAGALCIGMAQVVSHPWFDRIFGTCVGLTAVGGLAYVWFERKDATKRVALEKQVRILDRVDLDAIPIKDRDGKDSTVLREFSREMNDPEKAVVKQLRLAAKVKAAKAEIA